MKKAGKQAVFLALGSNLGDRGQNIQKALVALEHWGVKIMQSSSLYETEPVGFKDQPDFLNMVVRAETLLEPEDLLMAIQAIERGLGRERESEGKIFAKKRWGPRPIDIDILLYGDLNFLDIQKNIIGQKFRPGTEIDITTEKIKNVTSAQESQKSQPPDHQQDLIIPHPRMHERKFVLVPLVEIAPQVQHPIFKKTIVQLLKECADKSIVKLF